MLNFNLGENQKQVIKNFLSEEIDIEEFKRIIGTWKSNADNALAYLTNPIYYGLEFSHNPCEQFSNLENNAFNNLYLYTRMNLFALQNLNQEFNYNHKYLKQYTDSKPTFEGIEKVAVDFIEGKISFHEYAKQIKTFKNHEEFLLNCTKLFAGGLDAKFELSNLNIKTFDELYGYHSSLYNSIIKTKIKVFPTFRYIKLATLVRNFTLKYHFEHKQLEETLNQNILKYIGLDEVLAVKENFENHFESKISKIIEETLPQRQVENKDYTLVNQIDWPKNQETNKLFNLVQIVRENEKVSFIFQERDSLKKHVEIYIDESFIKVKKEERSFEETLTQMQNFVLGEREDFQDIMDYLHSSTFRFSDYESDYHKIPFIKQKTKNLKNCARHRLLLAEFCLKILNKNNIKVKLNEVYKSDFLKERSTQSEFKVFQDFAEGFINAEDFVKVSKDDKEFKNIFQHDDYAFYGSINEKPLLTEMLHFILSKDVFNTYDKHILSKAATIYLRIKNQELCNNYSYYEDYKKLKKYGLNYVDDSIMFDYVEEFLKQVPSNITKSKDVETFVKDNLKNLYTFEKSYPQWSSGANWQYSSDKTPMHFLQAKPKEPYSLSKTFFFKDKSNGLIKEITEE